VGEDKGASEAMRRRRFSAMKNSEFLSAAILKNPTVYWGVKLLKNINSVHGGRDAPSHFECANTTYDSYK
jgi:hypothetical protein